MRNFQLPGRSAAFGVNGMCATSSPMAALTGLDMLRSGGNAVDAAVTASATLLITEPHMTGIGGDCFALVGRADGTVSGINGSGRSAKAADEDWLAGSGLDEIAEDSIHAITVPGAVDAWDRLLRDHGTITLAEALAPVIKMAEEGVAVTPRVAHDWEKSVDMLKRDEGASLHYLAAGRAPRVGDKFACPALANTLRKIADGGRDAFYHGEVAESIVACLSAKGSLLSVEDFAATRADYVTPISSTYRGREVLEIPPNGQGITALIMLNILERLDMGGLAPDSVLRQHYQIEAARLAYELRDRHVADPGLADVPVDHLLSDKLADGLAARIAPNRAIEDIPQVLGPKYSDTIYLTVVDKDRTAVSFINSIYHSFGSGVADPVTGIMLQNRGSCFVAEPGHANCIGPRKRPMHTIIPAMVRENGRVAMPFGVMGGSYQPMGHAQVTLNMVDYGMDIQEALDAPRLFPEHGVVGAEEGIDDTMMAALRDIGHKMERVSAPFGGGQGIVIDWENGTLSGGSDPRKDGLALGY